MNRTTAHSFELFPIGARVEFRGRRNPNAGRRGLVIRYRQLSSLSYLGEVPLVRLDNGAEHYALKPEELKLTK